MTRRAVNAMHKGPKRLRGQSCAVTQALRVSTKYRMEAIDARFDDQGALNGKLTCSKLQYLL
jgi:hypothetical protein